MQKKYPTILPDELHELYTACEYKTAYTTTEVYQSLQKQGPHPIPYSLLRKNIQTKNIPVRDATVPYSITTPSGAFAPTGAKALYSATTYNYIKMKKRNVCNESTCVHCIVNVVGSLHQLSLMNMYVNILDLNQNAPFDVKAVLKNKKRILRRK